MTNMNIGQSLYQLWQAAQNAANTSTSTTTNTTTTTAPTAPSSTTSSPAIIVDLSNDTSGGTSGDSSGTGSLIQAEQLAAAQALNAQQDDVEEAADDAPAAQAEAASEEAPQGQAQYDMVAVVSETSAQTGSRVTAGAGSDLRATSTSASLRSAQVETNARVDNARAETLDEIVSLDASRAAAERARMASLQEALVLSVGKTDATGPVIKPIEADASERSSGVYAASTAAASARQGVSMSV